MNRSSRIPSADDLVRASYQEMTLYTSRREPVAIDLSDNTNQLGPPPAALAALREASPDLVSRYPSHYAHDLKRALSDWLGVPTAEIVTGCGSDDVLDSAIRAFAEPGDALAYPDPTFAMLPYFARMNGLEPKPVPLVANRGFDIDADRLLATGAKIIYICTPNNPTGTLASVEAIERVLREATGLVIVDEAYVEYAPASLVKFAKDAGRLLVARTLSKAFGLAGARVGYAVGAPDIVAAVEKSRGPYKVTALAERMAVAALDGERAWVDAGVAGVLAARASFVAELRRMGHEPLPSASNFVLVPIADAADKAEALRERGVGVRAFSGLTGIGDALRISVGPWAVMARALPALKEVLACA